MTTEIEIWKDILELQAHYKISNNGVVIHKSRKIKSSVQPCGFRVSKERVKLNQDNGKGYKQLYVKVEGVRKVYYIHRLVAKYFIPNPLSLPEVNHIDCNKSNNNFTNLEWCSKSENMKHASKMGRLGKGGRKANPVYQITDSGTFKWDSARIAAKRLGIDESSIRKCINGKLHKVGKCKWES